MPFQLRARPTALALLLMASGLFGFAEEVPSAVNINRADAQTIAQVLDGVGLKKAEAIVAYRQKQGGFKSMVDLADVKGIGLRTVEINEARIRLK